MASLTKLKGLKPAIKREAHATQNLHAGLKRGLGNPQTSLVANSLALDDVQAIRLLEGIIEKQKALLASLPDENHGLTKRFWNLMSDSVAMMNSRKGMKARSLVEAFIDNIGKSTAWYSERLFFLSKFVNLFVAKEMAENVAKRTAVAIPMALTLEYAPAVDSLRLWVEAGGSVAVWGAANQFFDMVTSASFLTGITKIQGQQVNPSEVIGFAISAGAAIIQSGAYKELLKKKDRDGADPAVDLDSPIGLFPLEQPHAAQAAEGAASPNVPENASHAERAANIPQELLRLNNLPQTPSKVVLGKAFNEFAALEKEVENIRANVGQVEAHELQNLFESTADREAIEKILGLSRPIESSTGSSSESPEAAAAHAELIQNLFLHLEEIKGELATEEQASTHEKAYFSVAGAAYVLGLGLLAVSLAAKNSGGLHNVNVSALISGLVSTIAQNFANLAPSLNPEKFLGSWTPKILKKPTPETTQMQKLVRGMLIALPFLLIEFPPIQLSTLLSEKGVELAGTTDRAPANPLPSAPIIRNWQEAFRAILIGFFAKFVVGEPLELHNVIGMLLNSAGAAGMTAWQAASPPKLAHHD